MAQRAPLAGPLQNSVSAAAAAAATGADGCRCGSAATMSAAARSPRAVVRMSRSCTITHRCQHAPGLSCIRAAVRCPGSTAPDGCSPGHCVMHQQRDRPLPPAQVPAGCCQAHHQRHSPLPSPSREQHWGPEAKPVSARPCGLGSSCLCARSSPPGWQRGRQAGSLPAVALPPVSRGWQRRCIACASVGTVSLAASTGARFGKRRPAARLRGSPGVLLVSELPLRSLAPSLRAPACSLLGAPRSFLVASPCHPASCTPSDRVAAGLPARPPDRPAGRWPACLPAGLPAPWPGDWLSVRPPVRPSIRPSVRLIAHPSGPPSLSPSDGPSVGASIRLTGCASMWPSVKPSVRVLVGLAGTFARWLPGCLGACALHAGSPRLSVCLPVCVSVSPRVWLCVGLSVCMSACASVARPVSPSLCVPPCCSWCLCDSLCVCLAL